MSAKRNSLIVALVLALPITAAVALLVERQLSHKTEEGGHDHGHEGHDDHDKHEGHDEKEGHDEHEGHDHEGSKGAHGGHAEAVVGRVELTEEGKKNAGIAVGEVRAGEVNTTLSLSGEVTLNADSVAHVTPRVRGTVREVKRQLGDVVKKGDVLATLDSRELAELVRSARSSTERRKLAQANFDRLSKLYDDKVASEKDYLASRQALAEAKIEAESAAAMLATAGPGASGTYSLVAPLDGTIIEKHCAVGEVLQDDTKVFIIADLSSVWVDMTVYAKDLGKVEVGQPVRIRADGVAEPAHGKISFVGAIASSGARSTSARVVLVAPMKAFRPGLFVTAEVGIEKVAAATVVPDAAIQTVDGKSVVFVEEDGAYEGRVVKTGRFGLPKEGNEPVMEITDGLAVGEKIVLKGAFILKAELGKGEAGHEH